jgi:Tol biopolymer transport system component
LRPTDGSPPVILGPGAAQSLSPDGKWALSLLPAPDDQILLLPTGAGTSKTLERGSVERYQFLSAKWFPDSRQIVFVAYESARGSRCYAQSIDAGAPRAFTPDGMIFCSVSPSGLVLALTEEGHMLLYPSISSGKPLKDFALESGENPVAWSPGGDFLYLAQMQERPITIVKLDVASGRRQPWKEIPVSPLPGNSDTKIHCLVLTPDGESYAYTYTNRASDLYLVQGLK